ncbi:MAG TPA: bifunctional diaminohydroxyphosphoribosylaminopyrimidine deaminase/5-amino-6-(5-phosphoribosylamino)uracil reductase RibD [Acidimicrobiia bacterium]|nr:bifunctional diaminohydroxyphosphoribosylaminopyrimidine deaminase/5-amino-6-(5-phosphoribosylamino)uracil reductase RibD [Acidimicrobiia bacterium]
MLSDEAAMAEAVAQGERGRLTAAPNPWVGCVVVAPDGQVVGRGFHERAGEPHAEVHALREAGERARGATVYVTLEPCAHQGRTPPCAAALVEAGVGRVVVAVLDPDERVSGRGADILRAAGITVDVGAGAEAAARSLGPYLHHRRTGRPLCLIKTAASIDGRTAAADGTSQWITGPEARADAHRLRAGSGAVVVGAGTALSDHPSLTFRNLDFGDGPVPAQPLRVLLDAAGRVPAAGPLFDPTLAPTLVLTTAAADPDTRRDWEAAGAEVEELPPAMVGVDLAAAMGALGRRGILQAMVEGGATLHGALLRAGLADRIVVYTGGVVLGEAGAPLLRGPGPSTLDEASRWRLTGVRRLGGDARLDWERVETGDWGGSPASPKGDWGGSPASPEGV